MITPIELFYSKDHEWLRINRNIGYVGITDFAQRELGDIVFVEVDCLFETIGANKVFGTIEAVKTVSDLFMPLAGKLVEVNPLLMKRPDLINSDPYGDGWIIKIAIQNTEDRFRLMTADQYMESVGNSREKTH